MSKRRISFLAALLVCGALFSVFATKARAVPETGTFVIITVDENTGERVGNVKITITQLEAEVVEVPTVRTQTDEYGILYHATHAGLYKIKAHQGATSITYLPSGAHDVYVVLPVRTTGS